MDLLQLIHTAARLGAQEALVQNGLTSGEISTNEAARIYGSYFRQLVADGRLHPVHTGTAPNSPKRYLVADILALRAQDQAAAITQELNTNNQLYESNS